MGSVVLCFGGPAEEGDDTAFTVGRKLKNRMEDIEFVICDSPLELLDHQGRGDVVIMDSVRGIGEVTLFDGVGSFRRRRSVTAHDGDLGMMLELLGETGKIGDVRIIGIPAGSDAEEAASKVEAVLRGL
jgi:hypothetical protein